MRIAPRRRRRWSASARSRLLGALFFGLASSPAAAQEGNWERSVQASANAFYGAAHTRLFAAELGLARSDSLLSVRSDFRFGYGDDRDADGPRRVTARALRLTLGIDYRPFARYSPFVFGTFETSLQQRIARRFDVGAGGKLTLLHKDRDDLSVSLAMLAERTRALSRGDTAGAVSSRARWSLRFRYRRQLTPSLFVSHVTFYQPAVSSFADRYTVDANTAIEAVLTSVLSLTSSLRHRYDNEARGRGAASNNDGQFLFGVRAKF